MGGRRQGCRSDRMVISSRQGRGSTLLRCRPRREASSRYFERPKHLPRLPARRAGRRRRGRAAGCVVCVGVVGRLWVLVPTRDKERCARSARFWASYVRGDNATIKHIYLRTTAGPDLGCILRAKIPRAFARHSYRSVTNLTLHSFFRAARGVNFGVLLKWTTEDEQLYWCST